MVEGGHPWPIYDLRIRSGRLELRLPTDVELLELIDVARAGIHDPAVTPFAFPWTDAPSPLLERSFMQYHWRTRGSWSPEKWMLDFGVWDDGRLVGVQGIGGDDFRVKRSVHTGSWLTRAEQGHGIGKEMRNAILAFAFDHLGAQWATSSAFLDNAASSGVSRSLGYVEDGYDVAAPRLAPRLLMRYRMSAEQWRSRQRPAVEVSGLEGCRDLFGAD